MRLAIDAIDAGMTLTGRTLSEDQKAEITRAVRKNLPLRGSRASRVTREDIRGAFRATISPTKYKGSGKRGEMRGSAK